MTVFISKCHFRNKLFKRKEKLEAVCTKTTDKNEIIRLKAKIEAYEEMIIILEDI
ncbi:hypothetical protein [Methanobacterium oryzae]|uniref:hypothetical protein n=1 Tax=Methanobacterium oryzae TaxID=69540 RepID=UPI003D1C7A21